MKRRAFVGPDAAEKYERSAQWILAAIFGRTKAREWCSTKGMPLTKTQAEGVNSTGGFLVPHDLSKAILDHREYYGAFRRRARLVPMASDRTSISVRPGGTGAFFFGENTAAAETSARGDNVGLTAKKIGSLIKVSSELEEDSAVNIVDFLANEIAAAFAIKEDDCAFNGDGTSTYGQMYGISKIVLDGNHAKAKVAAASGHNTFLTLDGTDLANLMAAVRASAIPNAAWFCSQTCLAQTFYRLAAGAGGGFMESRVVDGIETPVYLGFPVILTQKLPLISTTLTGQVMLVFGDMYAGAVLGERRSITIARSDHAFLANDEIGVLGTERFHAVLHDIGDATNAGSLAALVAP